MHRGRFPWLAAWPRSCPSIYKAQAHEQGRGILYNSSDRPLKETVNIVHQQVKLLGHLHVHPSSPACNSLAYGCVHSLVGRIYGTNQAVHAQAVRIMVWRNDAIAPLLVTGPQITGTQSHNKTKVHGYRGMLNEINWCQNKMLYYWTGLQFLPIETRNRQSSQFPDTAHVGVADRMTHVARAQCTPDAKMFEDIEMVEKIDHCSCHT